MIPLDPTARRASTRLALTGRTRRPAAILAAVGLIAMGAGVAILLSVFAPYIVNPGGDTLQSAPYLVPYAPPGDSVVAAAPAASPTATAPTTTSAAQVPPPVGAPQVLAPVDSVRFELRIPAIGYDAIVRQGVGQDILALGPGHYPDTPWPGQPGNVGVAGHNGYWLSFGHLKAGDRVEIRTQNGFYAYTITGSRVVDASDRTVLVQSGDNRLTMTTCYPLWAGALATQRLIFTAVPIGG